MTDRHTVDTINSDALDALYDRVERAEAELARLHEGEEPVTNPAVMHTPAQWIWQWNRATTEKRLQGAMAAMRDGATASDCRINGHRERIHDGRHAEMALNEVRHVVAGMEATTGARTWAGWLRDAMKRGPAECLLCATGQKTEPDPAATEAAEPDEEHDLVHALGGDRTAAIIAHTLTVHGHTLDAVRTMTYAQLLAVPGIGGPSLARIRAAFDGVPEPENTDQPKADPDGRRAQYAALAFNAVLPALKAHDRWLPLSVRRAVADAVLAVRDEQLEELVDRHRRLGIELEHWQTVVVGELRTERDQLAAILREVLNAFARVTSPTSGVVMGYQAPPIHPADYDRWRAVLNPSKEQH